MRLQVNLNPAAIQRIKAEVYVQTAAMFQEEIVPEAKRLSPVTPAGLARNQEMGKKRPGGTGDNRRSIDADTVEAADGVRTTLFTQSGHGGYLELGTSKMRAQPYLYPAFIKFIKGLPARIKRGSQR